MSRRCQKSQAFLLPKSRPSVGKKPVLTRKAGAPEEIGEQKGEKLDTGQAGYYPDMTEQR